MILLLWIIRIFSINNNYEHYYNSALASKQTYYLKSYDNKALHKQLSAWKQIISFCIYLHFHLLLI